MMRTLLVRGLIAGVVAGMVAAIFAYFISQPHIDAAIEIEEAHGAEHGHEHALVSRGIQSTLGLLVAQAGYGVAIGGLFALVFALVYGRFGAYSARAYSMMLAAGAFLAVVLVPYVKYPANPPGVGGGGSIASRTELYFAFLAISLIVTGIALYSAWVLIERWNGWATGIAMLAGYLAVMGVCGALLPTIDETGEFPASLLWNFRIGTLGNLVVLWVVLGLTFGALAQRQLDRRSRRETLAIT